MAKMAAKFDQTVRFNDYGNNDKTAKLGFKIDREIIDLDLADELLCGKRIKASIVLGKTTDAEGQSKLVETDYVVSADFDIGRIGVSPTTISGSLVAKLEAIDPTIMGKFAKRSGRLIVNGYEDLEAIAEQEKAEAERVAKEAAAENHPANDMPE